MKNVLCRAVALVSILSALFLCACANNLEQKSEYDGHYGTLVLGENNRAVQIKEISYADVSVLGSGMETVVAENTTILNGKGNVKIEKVPVGKNRVVVVQAKSGNSKLDGIFLTAVADISSGENNLDTINYASSVKGNVYKALIEAGVQTSDFTEEQEKIIENVIPSGTHASLIDAKKLASDYKSNPNGTFDSSSYILNAGEVSVSASNVSGYSIWLNDPLSAAEPVEISSDGTYTVKNVAPGSWYLYIKDKNGSVSKRAVSVESGKTCNAGKISEEAAFEGYRVHFYGANWSTYKIYYYNTETQRVSAWDSMPSMTAESDGYYYDLTESWVKAGTTMVIFYGGSNDNRYPADGQDGVVIPAGVKEAWFNFETKTFETSNPFSTEPAVSITPSGNASFSGANQSVTVTAKNCASAKYTTDGSDPKTSSTAVSFDSSKSFTVGNGISVGETVTVKVWGTDGATEVSASSVFTKIEKPSTPTRLGAYYTSSATSFSIWSPDSSSVTVTVKPAGGTEQTYTCTKGFQVDGDYPDSSNIYGVTVSGDLHLAEYQFKIGGVAVRDPYGKMIKYDGNQQKTNVLCDNKAFYSGGPIGSSWAGPSVNIVMDMSRTEPTGGWAERPTLEKRTDSIVYEVHVGDFTSSSTWNGKESYRGKFPGMIETGTTYTNGARTVKTGLDHLKELGVTHVQIMPMYDFATKYVNKTGEIYNWGYDPVNYNVPEDRYSTCPGDYVERIREVKEMVNEFHKNGIRVIMDVVYNHTFATEMFDSISSKYYTSTDLSGCGNSVDVSNGMVSRMVRDSLEYWAEEYNIDGFRFDLMAIFTKAALKDWGEYLNNTNAETKDRNLLMQGEPWQCNNNSSSEYGYASSISELSNAHIGCFAGKWRETLKGSSDDGNTLGYIFSGKTDKDGDSTYWNTTVGLRGSGTGLGSDSEGVWTRYFTANPEQAVNYLMAHDNLCFYDKIAAAGTSYTSYADAIIKFGHGILLSAQGIPFIHAGDEFLRTKKVGTFASEAHNSYMWGQEMNQIDWSYKAKYIDCFNYHKDMIQFRKDNDALRNRNGVGSTAINGNVIYYTIKNSSSSPENANKTLTIVINPGSNLTVSGKGTMVMNKTGVVSSNDTTCEGTGVTIFAQ